MSEIIELPESMRSQWNASILHMGGTYFHVWEWGEAIEKAYGWRTKRFGLLKDGVIAACLPVTVMRSVTGRLKGVSMAFGNYGGAVALPGENIDSFVKECISKLAACSIDEVELRSLTQEQGGADEVTFILDLPHSEKELWSNIGSKTRNQVRKAQAADLTIEWDNGKLPEFHRVYSKNMHRLGTPVHSERFFEEIILAFKEDALVLTVAHKSQVIAGMLCIRHGDSWADPFASSDPEYKSLNPNMLMYWVAISHAQSEGAAKFDFGRSQSGSGTYKFKAQWSAQPYKLDYASYRHGQHIGKGANELYRGKLGALVSTIWSEMPFFMHKNLGPHIRKYIP